jgi:hypothetical protein
MMIEQVKMREAIDQALVTLGDEFYRPFLGLNPTRQFDFEWFDQFRKKWGVARTIRKECLEDVHRYLDGEFRRRLDENPCGRTIDAAADHIQQEGWGSGTGTNGVARRPISLVSKVGFFLRPAEIVPIDRYVKQGFPIVLRECGLRRLPRRPYEEYLAAFNGLYGALEPLVTDAVRAPWVAEAAGLRGCPEQMLFTPIALRKIFDNYLMRRGGYPGDPSTR